MVQSPSSRLRGAKLRQYSCLRSLRTNISLGALMDARVFVEKGYKTDKRSGKWGFKVEPGQRAALNQTS